MSSADQEEKLDLLIEKLLNEQEESAKLRQEVIRLNNIIGTSHNPTSTATTTTAATTTHRTGPATNGTRNNAGLPPPPPITAVVVADPRSRRSHSAQRSSSPAAAATDIDGSGSGLRRLLSQQRDLIAELRSVSSSITATFAVVRSRQAASAPEQISAISEAMLLTLRGRVMAAAVGGANVLAAEKLSTELTVAASDPPLQLRAHWGKVKELLNELVRDETEEGGAASANKRQEEQEQQRHERDQSIVSALRIAILAHDKLPAAHRVVHAASFLAELSQRFSTIWQIVQEQQQQQQHCASTNGCVKAVSSDLALGLCFHHQQQQLLHGKATSAQHLAIAAGTRSRSISPPSLSPRAQQQQQQLQPSQETRSASAATTTASPADNNRNRRNISSSNGSVEQPHQYQLAPRTNPFKGTTTTGVAAPFSVFHGRIYAPNQQQQQQSHGNNRGSVFEFGQRQAAAAASSARSASATTAPGPVSSFSTSSSAKIALPSTKIGQQQQQQQRSASAGAGPTTTTAVHNHARFQQPQPQQHHQKRSYFHRDLAVPERPVYHPDYDDAVTGTNAGTTYNDGYGQRYPAAAYAAAQRDSRLAAERLARYSYVDPDEDGYFEHKDSARWNSFVATVHRPVTAAAAAVQNRIAARVAAPSVKTATRHYYEHGDNIEEEERMLVVADDDDTAAPSAPPVGSGDVMNISAITGSAAGATPPRSSPRGRGGGGGTVVVSTTAAAAAAARSASPVGYVGADKLERDPYLEAREREEEEAALAAAAESAAVNRSGSSGPTLSPRGSPNSSRSISNAIVAADRRVHFTP